jgi:hypothetical protein
MDGAIGRVVILNSVGLRFGFGFFDQALRQHLVWDVNGYI